MLFHIHSQVTPHITVSSHRRFSSFLLRKQGDVLLASFASN
jgi:isopentenyldiphosphate isomerase